ncbi:MAG: hypothetical protein K2N05_05325 [Muribaculaceae bacterium]|nr:hypothetical protein [Muribaculaceae bacterium]
MKQKLPIALLLGAAATFAIAQTVVVIGKDGKVTTFNAEDVKEITFENVVAPGPYDFKDVDTYVFGKAATLTFTADDVPTLVMDVYTGNANYLKARTYEVGVKSEANEGYFIDNDARWTYVEKDGD